MARPRGEYGLNVLSLTCTKVILPNPLSRSKHTHLICSYKNKSKRRKGGGRKINATTPSLSDTSLPYHPHSIDKEQEERESRMLIARVIEATHAISPAKITGVQPEPFMYWHAKKPEAAALKLLLRYPDLITYADKHCNGTYAMATKWAKTIGRKATNERSTQINTVKATWLSVSSPFHLATNVLCGELPTNITDDQPMQLSDELIASGLETIQELRDLLKSSQMYNNDVVYSRFCEGLESGNLKQSEKLNPTSISKLITIGHEAHFRLELWFALSRQKYAHHPNKAYNFMRKAEWHVFLELVYLDRKMNEPKAHLDRMQHMQDYNETLDDSGCESESFNPKYLS